ncbi:MAG TPA: hemerythrin domain-containing protein [Planctomycetes bacterium]|nr:hemerythrin domain-containing protein [Planctomycetota bacterium]
MGKENRSKTEPMVTDAAVLRGGSGSLGSDVAGPGDVAARRRVVLGPEDSGAEQCPPTEGMRWACSAQPSSPGGRSWSADCLAGVVGHGHALCDFLTEHGEILDVLDRLTEAIGHEKASASRVVSAIDALASLRDLQAHHEREEELLFPILEQSGFGATAEVLRGEHALLAELIGSSRAYAHAILFEGKDTREDWDRLRDEASALLTLQRMHLGKETGVLYPHALAAATPTEWERLALCSPSPRSGGLPARSN